MDAEPKTPKGYVLVPVNADEAGLPRCHGWVSWTGQCIMPQGHDGECVA